MLAEEHHETTFRDYMRSMMLIISQNLNLCEVLLYDAVELSSP